MTQPKKSYHGMAKASTGCSHMRLGNFCHLLKGVPSWAEDYGITNQCEAEEIASLLGGPQGIMHDAQSESPDSDLPAAYIFFAQFVDHDITLDTSSALHGQALDKESVAKLPNFRSPSLDLDCVYGFGPEASPFLFDPIQFGRLATGNSVNANDLPRTVAGQAIIGDPRNDENMFVAQMHLVFLRLHNRFLIGRNFEAAQQETRFHYQYVVWHDFLQRVCDPDVFNFANNALFDKKLPKCTHIIDECFCLCMPVEFAVAAFRFGHTLVRSQFPANPQNPVVDLFDERFGTDGFGPVPPELTVDWKCLLDIDDCKQYVRTKAFDHLLADELIRMPDPVVGRFASESDRSLAFRNLLRSFVLGLPSGQLAAQKMAEKGYPIDSMQDLKLEEIPGWGCLPNDVRQRLQLHTPLFLYLMREAGVVGAGKRLGKLGSAILLEVFGAMLVHGKETFLHYPNWSPNPCLIKNSRLTLADLVRFASEESGSH